MKKLPIKKHVFTVIVLAAAGLVLNLVFPNIFPGGNSSEPTASLVMNYSNGGVRQFTGEVIEQMTVLDAILAASNGANFKVEYERETDRLSIDGRSEQIKVKLNGYTVPVNMISQTMIDHGDIIEIELP